MIPYTHRPLAANSTGFASPLLHLLPGAYADDIEVELEPVSLWDDMSDPPKYEALSYVWGPLLLYEPKIFVKHRGDPVYTQPQYLTVRENLECALRHLRSELTVRTLWIDAICIYQENESEKSQQVAHMGSIYQLAQRVVIWFGPTVDGSREVVLLLNKLAAVAQYDFRKDLLSWTTGDLPPPDLAFTQKDLEALVLGVYNTWFDRVWTLQELGLTNPDTAVIQWGGQSVPFVSLQTAIIVYQSFFVDNGSGSATLRGNWSARRGNVLVLLMAKFYHGVDFVQAMDAIRYRNCHDPRDRIYAAIRLCRPNLDVFPNYHPSFTAAALYQEVCLRKLQDGADLIGSCEWPNNMSGLPSWVPNWHTKQVVHCLFIGNSTGLLRNRYRQECPGELICWGYRFANITNLIDLSLSPASSDKEIRESIQKLLSWVAKDFVMSTKVLIEVALALFAEGILESTWPLDVDPANGLVPMAEALRFLRSFRPGEQEEKKGEEDPKEEHNHAVSPLVARCIRERSTGRCFVKTSSCSFGLVLNSAKVGDQLFALPGCRLSIILRPFSGKRFRVIGSGSVASNNAGEALLGPIWPLREVHLTLEGGGYGYVGMLFGGPYRSDPRIERHYSTTEAGAGVRVGDEIIISDMYRAVTVDVLRNNGVPLEEITLF